MRCHFCHSTGERWDWQRQPECVRSRWWKTCRKWRGLKRRRTWSQTSQQTSSWRLLKRNQFTSRLKRLSQKWQRRKSTKLSKDKGWHAGNCMDHARAKKLSPLPENPILFRNGANLNFCISLNFWDKRVCFWGRKMYFWSKDYCQQYPCP